MISQISSRRRSKLSRIKHQQFEHIPSKLHQKYDPSITGPLQLINIPPGDITHVAAQRNHHWHDVTIRVSTRLRHTHELGFRSQSLRGKFPAFDQRIHRYLFTSKFCGNILASYSSLSLEQRHFSEQHTTAYVNTVLSSWLICLFIWVDWTREIPAFGRISLALRGSGAFGAPVGAPAAPI